MNLGDGHRDERNTVLGAIPFVGTIYPIVAQLVRALG